MTSSVPDQSDATDHGELPETALEVFLAADLRTKLFHIALNTILAVGWIGSTSYYALWKNGYEVLAVASALVFLVLVFFIGKTSFTPARTYVRD